MLLVAIVLQISIPTITKFAATLIYGHITLVMTETEQEISIVLEKHDVELRVKMKELITHSYFNAMLEIDRRRLADKAGSSRPRIDHFLRSIFLYVFGKLHKGDRLRAYEILEELRDEVSNMPKLN